jgi:aspartyl-tRNA(Asn)/glutamyl-tRNA(Gln) amidotransferase subunit A
MARQEFRQQRNDLTHPEALRHRDTQRAAQLVVISPAITRTAVSFDHRSGIDQIVIDGKDSGFAQDAWFPSPGLYNLTGHPAVSVPCGWASDGLPMAFQAAARWGEDGLLVRLAALYERAHPEALRAPPVLERG